MSRPPSAWKRRFAAAALAAVLLLALAVPLLPRLIVPRIEEAVADALGRRVEIGGLELLWLAGRVDLRDFRVGGPLEADPLPAERAPLGFDQLALDFSWRALLAGEIQVERLELHAPVIRLERDQEGVLAPLVLAEAVDEPIEERDESAGGSGWPIRLDRVVVRELVFDLTREGVAQPEIELSLASLSLSELVLRDGVMTVAGVTFDDPGLRVQRALAAPASPAPAADPTGDPTEASGSEADDPRADAPAPAPAEEGAGAAAGDDLLARHEIEALDVNGAGLTLLWEGGEPLEASLDLSARNVSARRAARFPLELTLQVGDGRIALEGELGVRPLAFQGTARWQELPLPRLLEASGLAGELELSAGSSAGELEIDLATDGSDDLPARLALEGRADVTSLEATRPDLELAWSTLSLELASLDVPLEPGRAPRIELSRVALVEPRIAYELAPGTPSDGAAARGSDAPAPGGEDAPADDAPPPPRVAVGALEVQQGQLRFRDRTLEPAVESRWERLTVKARGLRLPERDVESFRLTAAGSRGAELSVEASFAQGRGRVETTLVRLPLEPLDPYAARYTGLRVLEGDSSLDGRIEVEEKVTRTESLVTLHRLSVREEEAGWFQRVFGVPLDLALALLRDIKGDIRVPVNATFGQDASDVQVGSLLLSTLRQAILGAVTSPFKVLGGAAERIRGSLRSVVDPIEVVTGASGVRRSQFERLEELSTLLSERPALALVLDGRAGPADDAGIAWRRLVAQAEAGEPLAGVEVLDAESAERMREVLASADAGRATPPPEILELVRRVASAAGVDDAQRLALAGERARRVREILVRDHGVAEPAVVLGEPALGEPAVVIELRAQENVPARDGSAG